ncbi:tRNA(Ser) Um(44) 2'-O-methyltransferase [Microbotryomycetes sp. JL221]|nr:tRNA(Ser) Um(44) 2'-O-methyltransferase [Microbotryomycetes sp. JL221]
MTAAKTSGVDKGRATFAPSVPASASLDLSQGWHATLQASASDFEPKHFLEAMLLQLLHPEYNSSTILRAEILVDESMLRSRGETVEQDPSSKKRLRAPEYEGYECTRRIRRRLVPKHAPRDKPMEQECWIYRERRRQNEEDAAHDETEDDSAAHLVVLQVDLELLQTEADGKIPYYHPAVAGLAFRYLGKSPDATVIVDLFPLPSEPFTRPLPVDHRLHRTALALLKHLHGVAIGTKNGYEKRIIHDVLTDRDSVQDLYHQLKERYRADIESPLVDARITFRWMLREWQEVTDPTKHVWEDVAIAAWLIVLWRDLYKDNGGNPPGGFVDVGCGNGLLVYILTREGFSGYGLDLRERKSWSAYSPVPDLRTTTLHPPELLSLAEPPFPSGSFLIGNHADELTPWIPLFAAKTPSSAFLNIPCCLHTHSARFTPQDWKISAEFLQTLPSQIKPTPTLLGSSAKVVEAQGSCSNSAVSTAPILLSTRGRTDAYQLYLAEITLQCGFVPEREALRIPSTKNFGMVGRTRIWDVVYEDSSSEIERQWQKRIDEYIKDVVEQARTEFKPRKQKGSCI